MTFFIRACYIFYIKGCSKFKNSKFKEFAVYKIYIFPMCFKKIFIVKNFLLSLLRVPSNMIFFVMVLSIFLILVISVIPMISIFFLIFSIYKILKIMFYCNKNSYSLKCCRRKMMLLREKNGRLYDKIFYEDQAIVRSMFPKSKSYKLYSISISVSSYLPCKFLFDVICIFILNFYSGKLKHSLFIRSSIDIHFTCIGMLNIRMIITGVNGSTMTLRKNLWMNRKMKMK